MKTAVAEAERDGNRYLSHFSPEANLLAELQELFVSYGREGTGMLRYYNHDEKEAALHGSSPGSLLIGRRSRLAVIHCSTKVCTEP